LGKIAKYVALLRGINVGGKNVIKMSELKSCFENLGFGNVFTFIQSGNVLFCADYNINEIAEQIEKTLSKTFNYNSSAVVLSQGQLNTVVKEAPQDFGKYPDKYRYDVIFLKKPLSPSEAMNNVSIKEGVNEVFAGKEVLYFTRLISKASQSRLPRIIATPIYQNMTIRNWKTTTKLLMLLDAF
jgi:uncharacterized protein (DUF1697 family)